MNSLSGTLPEILFFAFQMTFAIITPALIVGAYVERIGFSFVLIFSSLWMLLCYAPVVHWIWGGGMLASIGEDEEEMHATKDQNNHDDDKMSRALR